MHKYGGRGPTGSLLRIVDLRYGGGMKIIKAPGFSLLLIGAILMFLIVPVIDSIPLIGGALQSMAFVVGALGVLGGAYLIIRAVAGIGR